MAGFSSDCMSGLERGALESLTIPREQCTRTDLDASEGKERLMDVLPLLITKAKPPVLVLPGQRPLHRPSGLAQPFVLVDPLLGEDRFHAQLAETLAVRLRVVGQVALDRVGFRPGA